MTRAIPPGLAASQPSEARYLMLSEFMTDGSLIAVCDALSRLSGLEVGLFNEQGQRIVRRQPGEHLPPGPVHAAGSAAEPAWKIADDHEMKGVLGEVPIIVGGQTIATMRVAAGDTDATASASQHLMTVLSRLSRTAAEFCESSLAQRRGLSEIGVLFDLTAMLVDGSDDDVVLKRALESALRIFSLDAGSIVLLPEDLPSVTGEKEQGLVLRAAVGLSDDWLESDEALSHGRVFDRRALAGDVVIVEDLRSSEEVRIPEAVEREGVVSFVCSGLTVRGQSLGVLRLYGRSRRTFSDTEQRLVRSIAQQAAASVHLARLLRLREREREYERQLHMAAEIQQRMLPSGMPAVAGLDIAARYQPSFEVGGDFYDVFETGQAERRKLAFVVGDVVGKGMPAAMLMASVRTALRAHADSVSSVEEVMERVNRDLTRDTRVSEFATMWYGVIDPISRTLRYTSAGHQPTFVVRAASLQVEELGQGGMVVGIDALITFGSTTVQLEPGDTVVAYTDGIDEAMDFDGKRFGRARLHDAVREVLERDPAVTARGVIEHLFWTLRQFEGLQHRPDDATVVVIRITDHA